MLDLSKVLVSDPKTKEPSVSLTMLVLSFVGLLTACGLQMYGVVENVSSMTELFYATTALYFSRRFNMGGKTYSSEETSTSQQGQ